MARRGSISLRWPTVSDFAATSEDNADVQIESFDSPESKPKKRRSLPSVKKLEIARISQSSPSPPMVFRRLPDDTVHISQSQSQSPASNRSIKSSEMVHISQSEPVESPIRTVSKFDSFRPRPVPKARSEPVIQPKLSLPKNGLASRLSNLLRQQQSEMAIWNHRIKLGTQLGPPAMELVVKKKISENGSCVICECDKASVSEDETVMSKALVIFKQDTWREYGLREDRGIMIFAPYLQLLTDRFKMPVIVGPMFLRVME